jgi:hypothetical protein
MRAKTKKRLKHLLTKKKLVKKKTSRAFLRSFLVGLATISVGSMAYAITLNKPTVSVNVRSSGPGGITLANATPAPGPGGLPLQRGRGSWYAFGLPAPDALTCASRTFPRGTYLKVTDLNNSNSVVCLVNDYGPAAWTGRVIDLSRGSFRQVDNLGVGTIPVEIRLATAGSAQTAPGTEDFTTLIGYNLCVTTHDGHYCDAHRQD